MVDVDLKEFLFTGRFGPVELGMHREESVGGLQAISRSFEDERPT